MTIYFFLPTCQASVATLPRSRRKFLWSISVPSGVVSCHHVVRGAVFTCYRPLLTQAEADRLLCVHGNMVPVHNRPWPTFACRRDTILAPYPAVLFADRRLVLDGWCVPECQPELGGLLLWRGVVIRLQCTRAAVGRTACRVAMVSCPYVTPAAGIHARRCNVTLVSRFVQRMRPQGVCACVAVLLLTARSRAQYISCNDLMDNVWNNDVRTIVVLFSACIGYIGSDSGVVTRASQTAPETLVSRLSGWPSTSCGKCSSIAATLRNSLPTGKQGGPLHSSTCLRL